MGSSVPGWWFTSKSQHHHRVVTHFDVPLKEMHLDCNDGCHTEIPIFAVWAVPTDALEYLSWTMHSTPQYWISEKDLPHVALALER